MQDQSATFYVASRSLRDPDKENWLWKLNDDPPQPYPARVWFPKRFHTTPTLSARITKINDRPVDDGPLPVVLTVTDVTTEYFEVKFEKQRDQEILRIDVEWSAEG